MWDKIFVSVKGNKIILFSFAALISFELISITIDKLTFVDKSHHVTNVVEQKTIIIVSRDNRPELASIDKKEKPIQISRNVTSKTTRENEISRQKAVSASLRVQETITPAKVITRKETVSDSQRGQKIITPAKTEKIVTISVNKYHYDKLASEESKLYCFELNESESVNVIFTNMKIINANASVYEIDVMNAEKVSVKSKKVLGRDEKSETGYIDLKAGKYYIKVSRGSIYSGGRYRLWIRK